MLGKLFWLDSTFDGNVFLARHAGGHRRSCRRVAWAGLSLARLAAG